jgi:GNAT superfamily N-acetyltransferase
VSTAVITVLLQVLYLAGFGQGGGKAADVGLDLRGDGVRSSRSARWVGLDGDEMAGAERAFMQAALERARELGITRTDREALGPLLEGFSRCCPQPGHRSGYDQG